MRYDDNDEGPPPRFGPAGAHRGLPMDPPGYGAGFDDGYDDDAGPPSWPTDDGYVLAVPAPLWGGWRAPYQPWRFRRRRPRLGALGGLARRSTRIGTLRSRRSGAAFPVFAASAGGRRWGLVTRPRRELEAEVHEIVAVRPAEELEFGIRPSPEPIPPLGAPPGRPGTTADGWRLRLPHQGLHSILSRLRPDDLAKLAGGSLPADPAPTVVRSVARLTAQSKRRGSLRSRRTGERMELFEAPGYSLLVRPAGEMQGEIVAVRPEGEDEVYRDKEKGYQRTVPGQGTFRVRGARVVVKWSAPVKLDEVLKRQPGKRTVYVILKDGRPIYVGKSESWKSRWDARLRVFREFSIPTGPYTVALGEVTWVHPSEPQPLDTLLLLDVEHILVRGLSNAGIKLTNLSPSGKVLGAPKGFRVENQGAVPPGFPAGAMEPRGADMPYEIGTGGAWG